MTVLTDSVRSISLWGAGRFGRRYGAAIALAGALALGACSSLPQVDIGKVTSVFGGAGEPAAPAPAPEQSAAVDFGTSTEIHPGIWPVVQSGAARDPDIEAQAARLLSRMTAEEKVGQLIQADLNSVTPEDMRRYHLGSILAGGDTGPGGKLKVPAPEWLKAADAYYDASVAVAPGRPVIPEIWGIDAVHGHAHIIGATLFPQNIGLGAARNPDLVRKIGEITAREVRITGLDWTFAPTIAVARDDRWGRTYESYSEDPKIVSEYAAAAIEGLQGKPGDTDFLMGGHIIANAKHFMADGGTERGQDQGDSIYSEEALRDIFAPPYEAAIKAGVQAVMASHSSWRGKTMHGDKELLTDVLAGRFGFDGIRVGDWNGHAKVPGCTKVDCPAALNGGLDMFMISSDWKALYANLLAEVKSGVIPQARLDDAVTRILRVKLRAGVMTEGRPSSRPYAGRWDLFGSPEHRAVARRAVRESLVLLKNDGGILPLSPRLHVLVAGDGADNMPKQAGGWTVSWQGDGTTRADFPNAETIFEGIKAQVEAAGGTAALNADGRFVEKPDVAIVVFGEDPYAEWRGDRPNVDFQAKDRRDLRLLQSLRAQGIPVVSVFLSGRPLYVTPEINASNAFVATWLPGSEGAGIADVLFAKPDGAVAYDFRGRLSFSWPRSPAQTTVNVGTEPYFPLFSYGYGLTYGTPHNMGMLPEAVPADFPAGSPGALVESGRAAPPWSLVLSDTTGERVATDPAPASVPTAALRVDRGDRNKQEDVLVATWSGIGKASLVVAADQPANFSDQTDSMALTMNLRVDTAPAGAVTLAMGSASRLGRVDLTRALKAAHGKGWTTIAVPLSCFRKAGADMGAVTTPMTLTTSRRLTVSLFSTLVMPAAGQAVCPAAGASTVEVEARPRVKAASQVKAKPRGKAKAHGKPRKGHAR